MKSEEGEKTRDVWIVGTPNVILDTDLSAIALYRGIARRLERTVHFSVSTCDYFLRRAMELLHMGRPIRTTEGSVATAFIDPELPELCD